MRPADARLRIQGATENNLKDVDVTFGAGMTAVVGVSGSGKSSLVFDTLYHEGRRRFLEALPLGSSPGSRRPAKVRAIHGLSPPVAVSQNVVNRNPNSTVATALGVHPYLRVLFARFAERRCAACGEGATMGGIEAQLARLATLTRESSATVDVVAPLVRYAEGTHERLLAALCQRFPEADIEVDGGTWPGAALDPDKPHEIRLRVAAVDSAADAAALRRVLDSVAALGCEQVVFRSDGRSETMARAPICSGCGRPLPVARPQDFGGVAAAAGTVDAYRVADLTLPELLSHDARSAHRILAGASLPDEADRARDQVQRRLEALCDLGLAYLELDRPSPTLSRGEAQRLRLAVILANNVEDLLHVLDEPSIGLAPDQVDDLLGQLERLAGPVVLVEHERQAIAAADHVVELGPEGGQGGGRVVFTGSPASLWEADTPSGRWFSGRLRASKPASGAVGQGSLSVRGARLHNLDGFDCAFPQGALTVVTGPSGAGKTTLARDVLVASLEAGEPIGCTALEGPRLRATSVDQSPIGRNPRSNPATYTGLATRIRAVFAAATGESGSAFSFNRPEGACGTCQGMGAVEVRMPFLDSEWVTCEQCQGRRFSDEVLAARAMLDDGATYSITDVLDATVLEAVPMFAADSRAQRILQALVDVGLGYLTLGQPSPALSGGEAQRLRLARQLTGTKASQLVYLDEPTTGLHPADLAPLLSIFDALLDRGCTLVVVEHNPDVVAAADWLVRIGPGGGPEGGRLEYAGPPVATPAHDRPPRREPRQKGGPHASIEISGASANNLRDVSVSIPKQQVTAIVGVSGSGKSSLVRDVLEAEATRRLLECLSVYERQSVREGPEADVRSVVGLGPTLSISPDRRQWDPRSSVGTATEVSLHLGVLLAYAGARECERCGGEQRRTSAVVDSAWACAECGSDGPPARPSDFTGSSYAAACLRCHGFGTIAIPCPERLIVRPDRPVCDGAMYSPGFFPRSYLCKPPSGGYWMLRGLSERYSFDPFETPWDEMSDAARDAFLYAEEDVDLHPEATRSGSETGQWRGVFRIVETWDIGGLYTEREPCPDCGGGRLRPPFLAVALAGMNRHGLHEAPLRDVRRHLDGVEVPAEAPAWATQARSAALRRLEYLERVGLGYLSLDRPSATLSAGEVQRVKLASLLGADLTGVTLLLDEPARGLHPSEVEALGDTLEELADIGNTVVIVDHDPRLTRRATHHIVLGPEAGQHGGQVVAAGPAADVRKDPRARSLVDHPLPDRAHEKRRTPSSWMTVVAPAEHNLCVESVAIPLGVLTGVCGVSGSGKSTLAIDILARALTPKRLTSSVAETPVQPGAHERIDGAPSKVIHADQSRTGVKSPGAFLRVSGPLRKAYARSAEAEARGLGEGALRPKCDECRGQGAVARDMAFMGKVEHPCDACDATGYPMEARQLRVRGLSLPELERRPLEEVVRIWGDLDEVARPLRTATGLGLGYLTLGQRSRTLSGGECQRLKLVREIAKPTPKPALHILDEPTVGLHGADVERLLEALDGLVRAGHSVLVIDHDPALLACCDWIVELGPGGGPDGGRVVAEGTPETVARSGTATAPYLSAVMG